ALDHVRRADRVQQLGLTVVDVAHDGHHRWAYDQPVVVHLGVEVDVELREQLAVFLFRADDLHVETEVLAEQQERVVAARLGRGHHLTEVERLLDQRARVGVDAVGEVRQRRASRQAYGLAVPARRTRAHRGRGEVVELLTALLLALAAARRPAAGTPEG